MKSCLLPQSQFLSHLNSSGVFPSLANSHRYMLDNSVSWTEMKAQQSTKFEASCGLWTRPWWYFGSVSRKTSWDRKTSKCKTAREKKKKNVRNNQLLFLSGDDWVYNTIPKSFYTPEIHKVLSDGRAVNGISLWSTHSELHLSISCLKSWLWPWHFISIALGMVL